MIDDTDYEYAANSHSLPDSLANRLRGLTTSDGFSITTVTAPTYGYRARRHAVRRDFDELLKLTASATVEPNTPPALLIGNFQVAHTNMDLAWF